MPVAITPLRKSLFAVLASVRSLPQVRANVVLNVAQFREFLLAGIALENLVLTARSWVCFALLHEALKAAFGRFLADAVAFALG